MDSDTDMDTDTDTDTDTTTDTKAPVVKVLPTATNEMLYRKGLCHNAQALAAGCNNIFLSIIYPRIMWELRKTEHG